MNHLKEIAAKLPEYGIDAMLCTSEPGEFYAIGLHGEGFVTVGAKASHYVTDSRYIEVAEKTVKGAQVEMVGRGQSHTELVNRFLDAQGIRKLGFEESYMSYAQYQVLQKALHAELVPAGALITKLRSGKDKEELERMAKAQAITDEAFTAICQYIKPGMTESEIAARLVYEMLRRGAQRVSFDPIVASGPNGSMPHAIPGERKVGPGEFITMDFGCVYEGYCSDMTRTVALGQPTQEMEKVYHLVLKAQLAGIAASQAGVPGKAIDAAARKVIEDGGYGEYFGHGYGHSVGLEIHESPNANLRDETPMPVGATVSAEPGIYLPGKFGVRIEDVVVMEEGGHTILTKSPKELIVL